MARPTSKSLSGQLSTKHQLIDKASTYLVVSSAVATIFVVFALFVSIELINKISYQNLVIGYRKEARDQLKDNIDAVNQLKSSYIAFDNTPESIIGTADKNSKIVLDALPSKYDFPAFITSVEFMIKSSGLTVDSIEGNDEEIEAIRSSINPVSQEVEFSLSATGNYKSIQSLIDNLNRSIRPFKIIDMQISGEGDNIQISLNGVSYYQPTKEVGINSKVVKSDEEFTLDTADENKTGGEN